MSTVFGCVDCQGPGKATESPRANEVTDDDVSITIESNRAQWTGGGVDHSNRVTMPVSESRLMRPVGEPISAAETAANGTLNLRFSNGQTAACYDNTPMYEASRLTFGDEEVVI